MVVAWGWWVGKWGDVGQVKYMFSYKMNSSRDLMYNMVAIVNIVCSKVAMIVHLKCYHL